MTNVTEVKRRRLLPYLMIGLVMFYIGHLIEKLYSYAPNKPSSFIWDKVEFVIDELFSGHIFDLQVTQHSFIIGLLCFVIVLLFYLRVQREGFYRHGEEHGSAKYAQLDELKAYADEIEDNNMILSKDLRVGLYNDRLPYQCQSNKNGYIIGGSGDGKTFTVLKPNALQLNGSKLFTDTKGLLVHELGHFFEKHQYAIKIFDLITFQNSDSFNPFAYMTSEMDIDRVANAIVSATKKSDNQGEDFWIQAELLLMRALIGYLYFDSQLSGYTPSLPQIADLIRHIKRSDPDIKSPVEMMFDELETRLPGNYACLQWALFNKNFDGETRNSVMAIISSRFSVFDHTDVRRLLERDTLDIQTWHIEKTAIFINIPETNEAYQFISALLFNTIFDVMIKTADAVIAGRHQTHDRLLHLELHLDELAQIGKIADFEKEMAVIRSREISAKLYLQSESQLDDIYGKEKRKTILNNCAIRVYLGTNDKETAEEFSLRSGQQTIQDSNNSETRGQQGSSSTQYAKIKRELLNPHEIMTLPYDEVLVFINRQNVFRDKKANVNDHKYAHYLANKPTDKTWYRYRRYMSDIDEFLSHVKPSELIEVTEEEIEAFAA